MVCGGWKVPGGGARLATCGPRAPGMVAAMVVALVVMVVVGGMDRQVAVPA